MLLVQQFCQEVVEFIDMEPTSPTSQSIPIIANKQIVEIWEHNNSRFFSRDGYLLQHQLVSI